MAVNFSTGTATSVSDMMTKLSTFAVANGWTQDYAASDRLFLHSRVVPDMARVYVAFRWASSIPVNVAIYHALGFTTSSTDPGNHTNDSGQGVISGVDATIPNGRHVPLVNGSMTYWFFEQHDSAANYNDRLNVVVKVATNDYRHFGCGGLNKTGVGWTGGEFAYGWRWNDASSDVDDLAIRADSNMLLDGLGTEFAYGASVHMENFPNQEGGLSGKWGVCGNVFSAGPGNDRVGIARTQLFGGFRGGGIAREFPWQSNNQAGLVPLYPITVHANVNGAGDLYFLGTMPGVRGVDLAFFAPEDTITIGAETWMLFPSRARGVWDGSTKTTLYQGIAYRRV